MATTTSPTSASRSSPTRRDHIFSFEFKPTGKADIAKGKGVPGSITLLLDGAPVGKGDLPVTIPLSLGLSAGVSIGSDAGAPVMPDYKPPFAFTGTVTKALVDVTGEAVEDMADSRLLKKSLRFGKKEVGCEIFRLNMVHRRKTSRSWLIVLSFFKPPDTLRRLEPEAWAGARYCRLQWRRRRRRGPWRGRAPTAA